MAYYSNNKKLFVNPYNFIPVTQPVKREENVEVKEEAGDLHTGFFTCNIRVYTPVAIPDTSNKKEDENVKEHFHYPLVYTDGKITIPASSLRGPVRSVYETITNSCMVTMKPGEHITRRSDLGTFQPGLLLKTNNDWELFAAERIPVVCEGCNGVSYKPLDEGHKPFKVSKKKDGEKYLLDTEGNRVYNGERVAITIKNQGHIKIIKDKKTKKETKREVWGGQTVGSLKRDDTSDYYLFLGESIDSKHAESVFSKRKEKKDISSDIILQAIDRLEETLSMYRSESINRNLGKTHYGYKGYERAKKEGRIPIWYKIESEKLFLSLAAIGRIAYNSTMGELSNGHYPCKNRKQLCPACAVFGMIGEENKGIASRVRFTNAIQNNDVDPIERVTLKELGTPRNAYLPFYSTNGLDYDKTEASIRGRKFYWHIPKASKAQRVYTDTEKTKRNATFDNLISPNSEFEFKVYYNSLKDEELDMLKWALTLGGNDSKCKHKIGHGKPLGLGSVKITISEWKERVCSWNDTEASYSILDKTVVIDKPTSSLFDNEAWRLLETMLIYDDKDKSNICYPWVELDKSKSAIIENKRKTGYVLKENVLASHQWFSEYKKQNTNQLPDITEAKNEELESYSANNFEKKDFERYKWEMNKEYRMRATGEYRNGRDGKPFFVYLEWEGIGVQIPYINLKKGKDATVVREGEVFNLIYDELNNNGIPKWKKAHK